MARKPDPPGVVSASSLPDEPSAEELAIAARDDVLGALMRAVMRVDRRQMAAEYEQKATSSKLTELVESHRKRREKADRFESDVRSQIGAVRTQMADVRREVAVMRPIVRRLRARELVKRTIVQCVARWRTMFIVLGVSIGGLITWLNDTWPKLVAILRKLGAMVILVGFLIAVSWGKVGR